MHTFSPAKAWIAGLDALRKPLLHLHTQVNLSLPWDEIDMDFMNLNQAAHGDREFGYIETRMSLRRKTVAGHASDPVVRQRVGAWARAATGWHASQHLRLARFGDNMRDVAVTEGDKVEAQLRFGVSVNTYSVNELVDAVEGAASGVVDQIVADYEAAYTVMAELASGGDRHDSLVYAARIEAGLRSFLGAGGFTAFTTNFEDLGGLRQLPGIAVQRLMADGYGFGAEGDWKSAVLVRLLKVMGAGLPGGTSFMEDYTYHLGPGEPKVLGAHMLEICPSIAAGKPSCEIHPLGIGNRSDPVRLVFDAMAARRQRHRDRAPGRSLAATSRGEGGLEAGSELLDRDGVLAHGGRAPPHRPFHGGRHGVPRRLRCHLRSRARPHRRGDDDEELHTRAALEPGLLQARPGPRPLREADDGDPQELAACSSCRR
jgi:L-arabinose isomerase